MLPSILQLILYKWLNMRKLKLFLQGYCLDKFILPGYMDIFKLCVLLFSLHIQRLKKEGLHHSLCLNRSLLSCLWILLCICLRELNYGHNQEIITERALTIHGLKYNVQIPKQQQPRMPNMNHKTPDL